MNLKNYIANEPPDLIARPPSATPFQINSGFGAFLTRNFFVPNNCSFTRVFYYKIDFRFK
ncbi:MAG: hypothetical protein ACKPKO_12795 [Candidatus Fonsibacter sp.]